ncbi:MAG: hypothetical protein JSR77_11050 [Planctomycetes bacterium]|nr:hypothetical protein [Planctomycetota bacterium]
MMMISWTSVAVAGLGASAMGQAFNLDFGVQGRPVPGAAFGAASGQSGQWMKVSGANGLALRSTGGDVTNVKCTLSGAEEGNSWSDPVNGNTGEFAALMDDFQIAYLTDCNRYAFINLTLRGLSRGTYRVFTYASRPDRLLPMDTYIAVSGSPVEGRITQMMTPNVFEEGRTHTVHDVTVTGQGNLGIFIQDGAFDTVLNGVQIVPLQLEGCGVALEPQDAAAQKEDTVTFSATITGDVRGYQWMKDGAPIGDGRGISGATTAALTLREVRPSDNGVYTLRYICGGTTMATRGATLTVDEGQVCPADFNGDGGVDGADVEAFFARWDGGC